MNKPYCQFIIIGVFLCLVGCNGQRSEMRNAHQFVAEVQKMTPPLVEPLPTFSSPTLSDTTPNFQRSPFTPPSEVNSAARPDANRPKEPLENFPLDQLHYVGRISEGTKTWGLIDAPDGTVYKITLDNYLGQNYGKIVSITSTKINLIETIPDGLGGWTQRSTDLPLLTTTQTQGSTS